MARVARWASWTLIAAAWVGLVLAGREQISGSPTGDLALGAAVALWIASLWRYRHLAPDTDLGD